jgi:hypothetical protein
LGPWLGAEVIPGYQIGGHGGSISQENVHPGRGGCAKDARRWIVKSVSDDLVPRKHRWRLRRRTPCANAVLDVHECRTSGDIVVADDIPSPVCAPVRAHSGDADVDDGVGGDCRHCQKAEPLDRCVVAVLDLVALDLVIRFVDQNHTVVQAVIRGQAVVPAINGVAGDLIVRTIRQVNSVKRRREEIVENIVLDDSRLRADHRHAVGGDVVPAQGDASLLPL